MSIFTVCFSVQASVPRRHMSLELILRQSFHSWLVVLGLTTLSDSISVKIGPWVVGWCDGPGLKFQCRGVLLVWMIVAQGPIALAVGAGGGCLDIFTLLYPFSPLSPSLWETARYRL